MNPNPAAMEKEKVSVFTSAAAPWYFGAYLNQARHNLFLTINELALRIGEKAIDHDDQLANSNVIKMLSRENNNPLRMEIAMKYLDSHLPFLFSAQQVLSDQKDESDEYAGKPHYYGQILAKLIVCLNDARNLFSHYHAASGWDCDDEVLTWMENIFRYNIDTAKKRFEFKEEEVQHLRHPDDRIDKKDKRFYFSFKKGKLWSDHGLAFFICLFLTREEAYLFLKKISGFKRGEERAHKATLEVFCVGSLRVPRERLQSKSGPQAVFLDMCNELQRCPQSLFDILRPEDQKVFRRDVIADEAESTEEEEGEQEQPEALLVRKENRFSHFALRYLDITNALPHIRFGVDLGSYHFSIYPKNFAGIEETRQLSKRLIGYGKLDDFSVEKRPDTIAALFRAKEEVTAVPVERYIRETAPHYHLDGNNVYLFRGAGNAHWPSVEVEEVAGKSYPCRLSKKDTLLPYATLSVNELPALILYHLLQKEKGRGRSAEQVIIDHVDRVKKFLKAVQTGAIKKAPGYPCRKPHSESAESVHEVYNKRWKWLEGILSGYQLRAAYIPEKIIDYLLNIEPRDFEEKAIQQLKTMRKEVADNLSAVDKQLGNLGKVRVNGARTLKVGKLAQQLTEDMLRLQPVLMDGKNEPVPSSKANNLAFRLLQSHLAYFSENRNNLTAVFEACGLIKSANKHPFLGNIDIESCSGIVDFYMEYFTMKGRFLDSCLNEGEWEKYHFLSASKMKACEIGIIQKYLNEGSEAKGQNHVPFVLPAGLFLHATIAWLKQYGDEQARKMLADNYEVNSVFLIRRLFKEVGLQPFYSWNRGYRLFAKNGKQVVYTGEAYRIKEADKITAGINKSRSFLAQRPKPGKVFLQRKEAAEKMLDSYRFYLESEKRIRLLAAQDILLFKCIRDLVKEQVGDIGLEDIPEKGTGTFLLSNISPVKDESAKSLLNYRPAGGVVLDKPFFLMDEKGAYVKVDGKKKQMGQVRIFDDTLKIKNAGNFRKLLKDRRLNNLFFYFEQTAEQLVVLHRMVLENELRVYDRTRLQVLPLIAEFEKALYDSCTEEERPRLMNGENMHHRFFLEMYREKYQPDWDLQSEAWLLRVRNAFSHNQFPHLVGDQFMLAGSRWKSINDQYAPSSQGSTLGYGIIEKIGQMAMKGYDQLIQNIKHK